MEMRDKIKLKSRNKKLIKQKEINPIQKEFIYEKNISKEIKENDAEKYEKLIVNKIIYYLTLCEYSQKMI
jgi:hypothetical protein